jgi:RNA 3'-terminal phosphate cyclase-like protein
VKQIRSGHDDPGLTEYESSFLKLIEKIMQGSAIHIRDTGTTLVFIPGILIGGEIFHECHNSRCVSYYLEPLLAIAPFCKEALNLTLTGPTNVGEEQGGDPSVDALIDCAVPILNKFGVIADLELRVRRRGMSNSDGGEVTFSCPSVAALKVCFFLQCFLVFLFSSQLTGETPVSSRRSEAYPIP